MSQEMSPPPPMETVPSQPWSEVWIKAITQPSVETFENFIRDPEANASRGFIWVFLAGLVATIVGFLIGLFITSIFGQTSADTYTLTGIFGASLYFVLCAAPLSAVMGVVGLAISAGITQFFASALGGTGTYSKLTYAFATFYAPISIITGVLSGIPYLNCLTLPLGIFSIVLNVIANKAVNQFSWGKAIASSVVILAILLVLVAVCVIVVLALLGPAIGNVFSNIVTDI